jgi:hypothetical protein
MAYRVTTFGPSAAVVIDAAMVTPALLLVDGALMVAKSRLGGEQMSQQIRHVRIRLDEVTP